MLDLHTFERRRGNTTAWYTTTWYRLHSTLKVGKDCHHNMSVEAHVKIICYEGTTKQILKGNHYLVYNQDW